MHFVSVFATRCRWTATPISQDSFGKRSVAKYHLNPIPNTRQGRNDVMHIISSPPNNPVEANYNLMKAVFTAKGGMDERDEL